MMIYGNGEGVRQSLIWQPFSCKSGLGALTPGQPFSLIKLNFLPHVHSLLGKDNNLLLLCDTLY